MRDDNGDWSSPADERLAIELHAERRAVLVVARGPVRGETYTRFVMEALARHPEAAGFARLYDLLGYTGSVGHADATRLRAAALAATGAAPREIVVATTDPAFPLWARALEATLDPPPRIAVVPRREDLWPALEALRRDG